MKRSRYNPEQIAFALRQAEEDTPVVEVCSDGASTPARSFLTKLSPIGSRNYISPCPEALGCIPSARLERQIRISPGEKHEQL